MRIRKAISTTAALALAAGVLCVPGVTLARGAGHVAARGPVFGLHPRVLAPRPFRPALAHHAPARLGWHLRRNHRVGGRNRDGMGAIYGGSAAPYYSGDLTGTVPETGPALYPPPLIPPAPAEHAGCFARGYDVPGESGGVAKVTVTRC